MDIETVNRMDRATFVATFGGIFENSPWVAARAYEARPFANAAALHAAMASAVERATRDEQLTLLRAHPDLAGNEAREGTLTESGFIQREIQDAAYRAQHGFPFILAVRHYTKPGILHEFERRIDNDTGSELAWALQQVFAITRLRIAERFDHAEPSIAADRLSA